MLLVACDGRSSEPAPARAVERSSEPHRSVEPAANPHDFVVVGLAEEPTAIALCARDAESLLVVDVAGERRYLLGSPTGTRTLVASRPSGSALRFCTAHRGSYLVASVERREQLADTLVLERLDAGAMAFTGKLEARVGGILATLRRSATDTQALVAFAGPEGPVRALRVGAETAIPVATELRTADTPDGLSREIAGAFIGESGWVVLYRRAAPEDDRGGVVMVTERGPRTLDPLHELALLESLTRDGQQVVLVGSFEFDRPHAFRFGTDGRMLEALRLAPGETPSFVPDRPRADVDAEPGGIELRLRDAAGDVRRRVHIARSAGRTPPALARDGHDFLVATTDSARDGWGVRIVRSTAEVNPR